MSPCEFSPKGKDSRYAVVCNTGAALQATRENFKDLTIPDLRELLCNTESPKEKRDCSAYPDLCERGRNSSWRRK